MYICIYKHIHIYTHTHIYSYINVYKYINICTYVNTYMSVQVCTRICMSKYALVSFSLKSAIYTDYNANLSKTWNRKCVHH